MINCSKLLGPGYLFMSLFGQEIFHISSLLFCKKMFQFQPCTKALRADTKRFFSDNDIQQPSSVAPVNRFTEKMIQLHTKISRNHLTPEIALHLITPDCHLWNAPVEKCPFTEPFWAFYWPGGQALTRYLLDHRELFKGKNVVEIGSGCGASAIACSKYGARSVIANDICYDALCAMRLNMNINKTSFEVSSSNLIGTKLDCDLLLLGDMFYDNSFTRQIADWLLETVPRHTEIYIGDPGRIYMKNILFHQNLNCVAKYNLSEVSRLENSGFTTGFVWTVRK